MDRRPTNLRAFPPVKVWLAGLLVVLLLALSVGSALHRDHDNHGHHAGSNFCAACLIAHGGVLADGVTGIAISITSQSFDLPHFGDTKPASVLDLRLAPGRAPPV